jgi:hypothetical protein
MSKPWVSAASAIPHHAVRDRRSRRLGLAKAPITTRDLASFMC